MLLASITAGGMYASFSDYRENEEHFRTQQPKVLEAVENDGMAAEEVHWIGEDNAMLSLNLGNCAIGSVSVKIEELPDGTLNLHGYNFSGFSHAKQYETRKPSGLLGGGPRTQTVIEGTPVDFTFNDLDSLKNDILGPDPCKTLASTDFIPR